MFAGTTAMRSVRMLGEYLQLRANQSDSFEARSCRTGFRGRRRNCCLERNLHL